MVMHKTDRSYLRAQWKRKQCSKKPDFRRDDRCGHAETSPCVRELSPEHFLIGCLRKVTSSWWMPDTAGRNHFPGKWGPGGEGALGWGGPSGGWGDAWLTLGKSQGRAGLLTAHCVRVSLLFVTSPSLLSSISHLPVRFNISSLLVPLFSGGVL